MDPDKDIVTKDKVSFCKASLSSGAMNVIKVMTQTIEDMTEVNNHTFRGTKLVPSPDQISTPQPTGITCKHIYHDADCCRPSRHEA